jgi:uncharacterized protein (TIGR00369 family)
MTIDNDERGFNVKQMLSQLLESCMEQGTEQDLQVLYNAIEGIQQKMVGKSRSYLEGLLHMEKKIDENSCEISIPINALYDNSMGFLHGGITGTVLDTVMGTLANYLAPEGYSAVTNQLNIHYLAPGIGDYLHTKAEVVHRGNKTMVISGEAYRSDGRKIAYASGTFSILQLKKNKVK